MFRKCAIHTDCPYLVANEKDCDERITPRLERNQDTLWVYEAIQGEYSRKNEGNHQLASIHKPEMAILSEINQATPLEDW